jgi:hypothetical protein
MSMFTRCCKTSGAMFSTALLVMTVGVVITSKANADSKKTDSLYVGDTGDNTVKRFDALTGQFQGVYIYPNTSGTSGSLQGPRGLIFDQSGKLDLVNQNQNPPLPAPQTTLSGSVLQFKGKTTGTFLKAIIPATDTSSQNPNPNAPFAPRGIILWQDKVLFVAEFLGVGDTEGRLLAYTKNGKVLEALRPDASLLPAGQFHPRGLVVGPNGLLYMSNFPDPLNSPLGGQVLRFDPETEKSANVFINDVGGVGQLSRPEGLVFGPDGRLYIKSFRANSTDVDTIRIYNPNGVFAEKIDLYKITPTPTRAFAQALLFGPGGFLFVPISGDGPDTGAVRRYNVTAKTFDIFVQPGRLDAPWYLTFGNTDPGTLAYKGDDKHAYNRHWDLLSEAMHEKPSLH